MRILIASDKFKGSATGSEVAAALADGIREITPDAVVDAAPVADGGEGTVDAAVASGFTPVTVSVTGPTGRPVDAAFAVRGEQAIIEMAAASGLDLLPNGEKDALAATSRGTGELIAAALDRGATSIVLGVGGSACTDGGAGMLQALGVALRTEDRPVRPGGAGLVDLVSADISGLDPRLDGVSFVLAADVDNPLLGDRGAAAVFAPQKGASADDVAVLEAGLSRLAEVVDVLPGVRPSATAPGAGAAGGVGYAALAVLGAVREAGIDVILRLISLDERIADADLVITGEGSLDDQSLGGKTPLGVSAAAARAGKPVVAVCGRTTLDAAQAASAGFGKVYALSDLEPEPAKSMANAVPLLREVGRAIAADLPALTAR
ncbi:glycerate kinase [Microbacterium sp. nov. GSS16]|uniref:glycerate kinase n=1 Tax=Microbacterium sp. nov. GSS16 TaxID=3019890 RepID=UPI0023060AD7|nr:glycerate kinase [Microbacterium sp. nov. GSS16]WCD93606.1 glycerate kinase [Microbacterium sp. nov. GSS16]